MAKNRERKVETSLPESEAGTPEPARSSVESVWGVLGTSFTLGTALMALLVIVAAAFLWRPQEPADAEERLAGLFRGAAPPFGLELVEATKLPTQETILRLAREDAPVSDELVETPDELLLIWYRDDKSARASFEGRSPMQGFGVPESGQDQKREASRNMQRWLENPDFAWHTTREAGEVEWSRWRVRYRVERSFRDDGTWRDSTRLLLSRPSDYLVLFAQTPVGVEASEDTARAVARELAL